MLLSQVVCIVQIYEYICLSMCCSNSNREDGSDHSLFSTIGKSVSVTTVRLVALAVFLVLVVKGYVLQFLVLCH
jgi:hypothetical protein